MWREVKAFISIASLVAVCQSWLWVHRAFDRHAQSSRNKGCAPGPPPERHLPMAPAWRRHSHETRHRNLEARNAVLVDLSSKTSLLVAREDGDTKRPAEKSFSTPMQSVRGQEESNTVPPNMTFWRYRLLHRRKAEMLAMGLLRFPRATLIYVEAYEQDGLLAFLAAHIRPLPLLGWQPPTSGMSYLFSSSIIPHLLVAAHTYPFFRQNYWTMYVLALTNIHNCMVECGLEPADDPQRYSYKHVMIEAIGFLTFWYCVWPFIPWVLCDLWSYTYLLWCAGRLALKPIYFIWQQRWGTTLLWLFLSGVPLVIDGSSLLNILIYCWLMLPIYIAVAMFRMWIGRQTPDTVQRLLQLFAPFIVPKVNLNVVSNSVLESSISQLNAIALDDLRKDMPLCITYVDKSEDGGSRIQEGFDLGGLYRDWLSKCADALVHEQQLFVRTTVNNEEVLRLDVLADDQTAKFAGRILALSLKAGVPIGWTLCEPLWRLLLFPKLPELLAALQVPSPHSIGEDATSNAKVRWSTRRCEAKIPWKEAAFLSVVGLDPHSWIRHAVGDGEAKWYHDCLDEAKDVRDRQALLESVCTMFEGESVTLASLNEWMMARAKSKLLVDVSKPLLAFWKSFREVPVVTLRDGVNLRHGSEKASGISGSVSDMKLVDSKPEHWNLFFCAVAGEVVNIEDWQRHTRYYPEAAANEPIVDWFWEWVRELEPDDLSKLLFWVSGFKRIPHGGWTSLGQQMVLNVVGTSHMLPVAHTCSFQIDLPRYTNSLVLELKLEKAMEHGLEFAII